MRMFSRVSLPSHYDDNTLVLMVQSPQVLYVYWELSPAQRAALMEKGKLQLRLNIVNAGTYRTGDIQPFWDSFYFTGVEPGCAYYCDISVKEGNDELYPLIYSNIVFAPPENSTQRSWTGSSDFRGTGEPVFGENNWVSVSSEAFYRK